MACMTRVVCKPEHDMTTVWCARHSGSRNTISPGTSPARDRREDRLRPVGRSRRRVQGREP